LAGGADPTGQLFYNVRGGHINYSQGRYYKINIAAVKFEKTCYW